MTRDQSSSLRRCSGLSSLRLAAAVGLVALPIGQGFEVTVVGQTTQAPVSAPTPAATFQDKFITTSEGQRIHYLDWGTPGKRPFIMLHGINRSGHTFDHIAPLPRPVLTSAGCGRWPGRASDRSLVRHREGAGHASHSV